MSTAEFLLIIGGTCFVFFGIAGMVDNRSLRKELKEKNDLLALLKNPIFWRDEKGRFCKKSEFEPGVMYDAKL